MVPNLSDVGEPAPKSKIEVNVSNFEEYSSDMSGIQIIVSVQLPSE